MPDEAAQGKHKCREAEVQYDAGVEIEPFAERVADEADLVGRQGRDFLGGLEDEADLGRVEGGAEVGPDAGGEDDVADGDADGAAEGTEGGDGGHVDGYGGRAVSWNASCGDGG